MPRLIILLLLTVLLGVSMAFTPVPGTDPQVASAPLSAEWWKGQLTLSNIVSGVILVYHFGYLRRQIQADHDTLIAVQGELKHYKEVAAPATFARKDVAEEQLAAVNEKLDLIMSAFQLAPNPPFRTHKRASD